MYYIYSDTVYPGAMKGLTDLLLRLDQKGGHPFTQSQFSDDSPVIPAPATANQRE